MKENDSPLKAQDDLKMKHSNADLKEIDAFGDFTNPEVPSISGLKSAFKTKKRASSPGPGNKKPNFAGLDDSI